MLNKLHAGHLGLVSTFAIALLGNVATSQAQPVDYEYVVDVAEVQGMMTQRMTAEVLLVAMNVDRMRNLERLEQSRDQFDRTLRGFRDGDSELGIPAFDSPEMRDRIDAAEDLWASMDAAISTYLTDDGITPDQVEAIAELSLSLQDAVDDIVSGLRQDSQVGEAHSMLAKAVETAGQTRVLSQQMTKEFLLVAYGHQASRNRYALRETLAHFETGLFGLLEGDFDRLLLPAPTPEIRAQLQRVERIWKDEYRPLIDQAINEEGLTNGTVALMARVNLRLLREIDSAAELYREL